MMFVPTSSVTEGPEVVRAPASSLVGKVKGQILKRILQALELGYGALNNPGLGQLSQECPGSGLI
jgi:hypothetical protein